MGKTDLVWSDRIHGKALIVAPSGHVDGPAASIFADSLADSVDRAAANGLGLLILDLSYVDYISSRGLRALTIAQRRALQIELSFRLARPGARMQELLEISRYDTIFGIYPSIEAAMNDGTAS